MLFGDTKLGPATGFAWERDGTVFLITNWHVVTGKDPQTHQPLSEHGSTPDALRVWLHNANNLGQWKPYDLNLFDNQLRPLWKEHEVFRSKVDVAAVELDAPSKYKVFPINKNSFTDFRVEVSHEVFIIGFPRGITGAGKFPIWKRGSIASEPDVDLDGLPKLLIDSMTRKGMSGSPVIAQYVGYYGDDPTNPAATDWIGMGRNLLGVYSGRLPGQDEFEAHLGIVWKASVIDEIVISGVRPD